MTRTDARGIGAAMVAFEQIAVRAAAVRVRESKDGVSAELQHLVAALEAACAATTGLLSGAALAECAGLLAKRSRDLVAETEAVADGMDRGVAILVAADEEGAGHVADAAG